MRFVPLIWSALWRKPVEAILTWLAVTAAFALFGVMLGVSATLQAEIDNEPLETLFCVARFPGVRLQTGMRESIARVDGVAAVAVVWGIAGHHVDRSDPGQVAFVDEGGRAVMSGEFGMQPDQWDRLFATPNGIYVNGKAAQHWHLKEGDVFTVTTDSSLRADGALDWPFQVLGLVPDRVGWGELVVGNYRYGEQSRPPADRGLDVSFRVLVADGARSAQISRELDRTFANSGTPTKCISMRAAYENMGHSNGHGTWVTTAIGAAGLFMILLLIANGIAQSVQERLPEFAVLRTFGFRTGNIMALVFCEAAIPCLAGALLGMLVAQMLSQWPTRYLPGDLANLAVPTMSVGVLLGAVASAVVLACISSIAPLLRVRRMSVASELAGL